MTWTRFSARTSSDASHHGPTTPWPIFPRNRSSAGQSSAASSTNTSEPPESPGHSQRHSSGTPQAGELCDVVLAALVALATVTGGTPQAESRLARHVAARAIRLRAVRATA